MREKEKEKEHFSFDWSWPNSEQDIPQYSLLLFPLSPRQPVRRQRPLLTGNLWPLTAAPVLYCHLLARRCTTGHRVFVRWSLTWGCCLPAEDLLSSVSVSKPLVCHHARKMFRGTDSEQKQTTKRENIQLHWRESLQNIMFCHLCKTTHLSSSSQDDQKAAWPLTSVYSDV